MAEAAAAAIAAAVAMAAMGNGSSPVAVNFLAVAFAPAFTVSEGGVDPSPPCGGTPGAGFLPIDRMYVTR